MKLTLGDKEYVSDLLGLYKLTIGEARVIKRNTDMGIAEWRFGLISMNTRWDPDVMAGIVFLLRARAGERVDWSDIDTLTVEQITQGFDFTEDDQRELDDRLGPALANSESGPSEQLSEDTSRDDESGQDRVS